MPQTKEKIITPEKVVLKDGRKGYFFTAPVSSGAVIVVKYQSPPTRKRAAAKIVVAKKAKQSSHPASSVATGLKEVKSRKQNGNYPRKDFDTVMDEL